MMNQVRAFLIEQGIIVRKTVAALRTSLQAILDNFIHIKESFQGKGLFKTEHTGQRDGAFWISEYDTIFDTKYSYCLCTHFSEFGISCNPCR